MSFDLLPGKERDLGGFSVRRILPAPDHRSVGPFVFFDHLGPAVLPAGPGVQVRPHPHIGLATVTYLFDGELVHRDSLGSVQTIRPGDVNWMTAGRGIVHSERSPERWRGRPQPMHAIQSWVALPLAHEHDAPSFAHHPAATLPTFAGPGVRGTLVAGTGCGCESPVAVLTPTLYAVMTMDPEATWTFDATHEERAVFCVDGDVAIDGEDLPRGAMAVLTTRHAARLDARTAAVVVLLGGAALDGPVDAPRTLEWNFVASDPATIATARADWLAFPNARFPRVPGETESIPLPPPSSSLSSSPPPSPSSSSPPPHEPTVL